MRRLKTTKQKGIDCCATRWPPDSRPSFTLEIRGSYAEAQWATSLAALDVSPAGVVDLMTTLVPLCLTELDGLYKTRSTALRQRLAA
jgi:hypothetical protein